MGQVQNYFSLQDEVAIITGGGGLLGEKHAEAILDMDGSVVLVDINEKSLNEIYNRLGEKYEKSKMLALVVDITDEEQIEAAKNSIVERFGKVDILINNAANNPTMDMNEGKNYSRFENFRREDWIKDIEVGLTGAFLCSKIFGSLMAERKKGVILNISSDLGIIGPDQRLYKNNNLNEDEQQVKPVTYSVVKTGLIGLTRYLATYWADKNIRTNAVAFGGVFNNQDSEFLDKVKKRIPMGRLSNKDEYKASIIYLCSKASSYMNGATVVIDGGRTIW